ncbi:integumentary mucin C.1-like [Haliotis asinina]|uniref:integumentary mucin C.1-like n=1 Tax=Haliotis asinina TaxID=109174 RepID=UPI003532090D
MLNVSRSGERTRELFRTMSGFALAVAVLACTVSTCKTETTTQMVTTTETVSSTKAPAKSTSPTETETTTQLLTTTETVTTTKAPAKVALRTRCAYNDFLTKTTRMSGDTPATSCQDAPGFVSINTEIPGVDPQPICSAVLISADTVLTSDFCIAQLAAIPEAFTVAVNDFTGSRVATISGRTGTDGKLTLDVPVTFDGASCLLPACIADDTMELDMTSCTMFGAGLIDGEASKFQGTKSAPISIVGICADNTNMCSDSTTATTCNGDAGGPLICPDRRGQLITAGLVADMPPGCSGPPEFISLLPDTYN